MADSWRTHYLAVAIIFAVGVGIGGAVYGATFIQEIIEGLEGLLHWQTII